MVKSQAKTTVFSLTASRPNTQVRPSRGRRMTVAFRILLKNRGYPICTCIECLRDHLALLRSQQLEYIVVLGYSEEAYNFGLKVY